MGSGGVDMRLGQGRELYVFGPIGWGFFFTRHARKR